jgi:hypothetical protein
MRLLFPLAVALAALSLSCNVALGHDVIQNADLDDDAFVSAEDAHEEEDDGDEKQARK